MPKKGGFMVKILTIIVPVYNTEKYILRCFNSINNPAVNVIVVDDGSFDKSPEIIDEYCKKHDNFKVIHTQNQGAATARVTGLKQVETKYFCFVDSDDIVNIDGYLDLVYKMDKENYKVGNGRMTVYLPDSSIPFNSRIWQKEHLDFSKDKLEFSNATCSLVDKIWHIDCAPLLMTESKEKVYEDMEIVYYVMAKNQIMLHSNDLIYSYCMRGLHGNSTCAIGLQETKSNGLDGLISAGFSMKDKFKEAGLYSEYKDELDSIMIKLIHQRIFNILKSEKILNKKEMAELAFKILNSVVPNWTQNKYLLSKFKGSEYNDLLFYIGTNILKRIYNVQISELESYENYDYLIDSYDKVIRLKK